MRKANTDDLFNIARLIDDLGLKEDLFEVQKGKEDIEKIGFDFVFKIFSKAIKKEAQQKIYEVLSEPFEIKPQEVGKLGIMDLIKNTMECFDLSEVINFIKRANS